MRTLATAVLSELRWLEGILTQVYEHGPASYYDPLEHPMIQAALPHMLEFKPHTAERLSHFHNLLRDVRALMDRYRQVPDQAGPRRDEFVLFAKTKAYYAISAIEALATALRTEGGHMPPAIAEKPVYGDTLPALPTTSFESFSVANGAISEQQRDVR